MGFLFMGAYSKLHSYTVKKIRDSFPVLHVLENCHPDWLLSPIGTRLELDIFIPEIDMAIEIQGAQHFSFISFFHKEYSDFEKQKLYDEEKRNLCYGKGIKLIEICTEKDADIFISDLCKKYKQKTEITPYQLETLTIMRKVIKRNGDKTMLNGRAKKCLRMFYDGQEPYIHPEIVKYLGLTEDEIYYNKYKNQN